MSSAVHIARNGAPLGQFPKEQIQERLENGSLLPGDYFYDESARAWLPLTEWREAVPFTPVSPKTEEIWSEESETSGSNRRRHGGSRSRRKPKKRNPAESALPGWIACLFAIGVAAALWAWAQSLRDQLQAQEKKAAEFEQLSKDLQRQNAILLEMAPVGVARGVLTSEPSPGKLAVMSGVTVGALRAEDVRTKVVNLANEPTPNTEEELGVLVTKLQSSLPPAIAVTITDSSGRFELPLPEPGRYILIANAFKQGGGTSQRLLWLVEFERGDEPTPVLSMSEQNAITLQNPNLRISPGRK